MKGKEENTHRILRVKDKLLMISGLTLLQINYLFLGLIGLSFILKMTVYDGIRCMCAWDYIALYLPTVDVPFTIIGIILLVIALVKMNEKTSDLGKNRRSALTVVMSSTAVLFKATIVHGYIFHYFLNPSVAFRNMYKTFYTGEIISSGAISILFYLQGKTFRKRVEETTSLPHRLRMPLVNIIIYCVWVFGFIISVIVINVVVEPSLVFERQALAFGIGLLFSSVFGTATIIELFLKQRKLLIISKPKPELIT
jgi:hypothetical protein